MIDTLLITIIVEGLIVLAYCKWSGKPLRPILITSVLANVLTQVILWLALNLFFRYYIAALSISEVLIWLAESILLSIPAKNQLRLRDAMLLSLIMNLVSFGAGWLLPI